MRVLNGFLLVLVIVIVGLSLFHASWLAGAPQGRLELVAIGGAHQLPGETDAATECPTARIASEQFHPFIANSAPGIRFARSRRANYVEVIVRQTADNRLVLFTDDSVDCRTDGEGRVADLDLATLQRLDIGYDLTPDGETFPLRGRGIGLIPSIADVVDQRADSALLYRFAEADPAQAALFRQEYEIAGRTLHERAIIIGEPDLTAAIQAEFPDARILDVAAAEACFDRYVWTGVIGQVPEECRGGFLSVPFNRQWMAWGWPNRFNARMRAAGITPMIVASHDGDDRADGLVTVDQMRDVAADFRGLLWVEDIDFAGPAIRP